MRPTACLLNDSVGRTGLGKRLLMLGGRQDRSSHVYSFKENKWVLSPKLPKGHNITTTIAVNWQEKAVFTFIIDAQLTIKSACLDLEKAEFTELGTENTSEMYYAMELSAATHKMDRLHVKSAVTLDSGSICVFARGRLDGMVEQISGLLLHFKPIRNAEDGKYRLELEKQQRVFPSIFCRQLDFMQKHRSKVIVVQDTADEEKFEAFSIETTDGIFRCDNVCQKHMRHIFQPVK